MSKFVSNRRIRDRVGLKYPSVGGVPCISEWDIEHVIYGFFEIAADRVRHTVPSPLQLVELRPGTAVLQVSPATRAVTSSFCATFAYFPHAAAASESAAARMRARLTCAPPGRRWPRRGR